MRSSLTTAMGLQIALSSYPHWQPGANSSYDNAGFEDGAASFVLRNRRTVISIDVLEWITVTLTGGTFRN